MSGKEPIVEFLKAPLKRASLVAAVILLGSFAPIVHAAANGTTHLQILVNGADPSFKFVINDGTGLHYNNPFYPRPFGSNYILNGLIFPGGTINVDQSDYTVNERGVKLTAANSIGLWECLGNVLTDLLNLPNIPSKPTLAEQVSWNFFFTHRDGWVPDNVYTYNSATTGVLAPGRPFFTVVGAVIGGTGQDDNIGGDLTAQIYFQQNTGTMLINITFDNNIRY
ncbi:MAG: hypothetical protein WB678_00585 [Stellaceae bacterium]